VAAFCAQARTAPRLRKIRMHTEKTFFEDLMLVPPGLKENGTPPAVSLEPHRRTWHKCFLKFSDCRDYPHRGGKRKALRKKRARGGGGSLTRRGGWPSESATNRIRRPSAEDLPMWCSIVSTPNGQKHICIDFDQNADEASVKCAIERQLSVLSRLLRGDTK
jgi:hypothetical protein